MINYANEKLQQKFTKDVFKTVQVEYEEEGITWSHINFVDNQQILTLLESRMGILSLLDEELMRPKGNEESFVSKVSKIYQKDHTKLIQFPKTSRTQFCITHYATPVTYEALGFLDKNKDTLVVDLLQAIQTSNREFIQTLFRESSTVTTTTTQGRSKKKMSSVGHQFKTSLDALRRTIDATNVHYIRCIKPNANKSPTELDHEMVVTQLRCAGVIEAIRISRTAYPNRLTHSEFLDTFYCFRSKHENPLSPEPQPQCLAMLHEHFSHLTAPDHYQIGLTKIYFQKGTSGCIVNICEYMDI